MSKLTREEVLHVANLARLELTEDEIEKYSYQLKELLNEINKINDIDVDNGQILISPWGQDCKLSEDIAIKHIGVNDVMKNAPHKVDTYIEVRGVFDE